MTWKKGQDPEVGQWWLYRDALFFDWPLIPRCNGVVEAKNYIGEKAAVIVVTDVYPGQLDRAVKVQFMKSNSLYCPYDIGEFGDFMTESFKDEGYFKILFDPIMGMIYNWSEVKREKYGLTCPVCKEYYPYADVVTDFKCWSCTNGA